MVSGGIKVVVRTGRIMKEDIPGRISPFIRIKAGSRLADSKKLTLDSTKNDISWNESLSLIFKNQTQLHIYLLDADRKISQFQNQIGVCVLNLEMLSTISGMQEVFGVFHSNNQLAALVELEITYQIMVEEKIEAALQLKRKQTVEEVNHYSQPSEQVYDKINLKFRVIQAAITHNTEALGDMSPYCLIKVRQRGDFKTDIMKGKNPKFNQVFIIQDIDDTMVLQLGLWDKETMKDDDFIGGTTINMKHLMNQQAQTKDIPIKYLKGQNYVSAGTVRCQFNIF